MNCHHTRQLISPYLDHQLTGQQMLELQQHFVQCPSCEAELRSLRQLKQLLRALHQPQPRQDFSDAISSRLAEAESPAFLWKTLLPSLPRPQRGRRLASALALSCLTVLAVAAPFAQDGARASWAFLRPAAPSSAPPGDVLLTAMPSADVRPANLLILTDTDEARRERTFAAQYAQPAQPDPMAAPLTDDAVRGYVQGDIAFAGYRTR